MQLESFIRSKLNTYAEVRALTAFEETCLKGESMKHSLSYFYTTLTGLETAQELTFLQAWERDLEMSFSHAQKGRILLFNQKASVASRCQEGGIQNSYWVV